MVSFKWKPLAFYYFRSSQYGQGEVLSDLPRGSKKDGGVWGGGGGGRKAANERAVVEYGFQHDQDTEWPDWFF